jgi:hypothetical protein
VNDTGELKGVNGHSILQSHGHLDLAMRSSSKIRPDRGSSSVEHTSAVRQSMAAQRIAPSAVAGWVRACSLRLVRAGRRGSQLSYTSAPALGKD